ncbi:hypothetical protein clem_02020 [Legionella clemsonensis]|uniref:Uncharacterized protein n=1 Tax=Legionella clemsonensis TaxID=1867846 RepID=A0A222NZE3_9GAMM|nr:hypothetical protein clem_02020 [Legionella clemsonensis]
MKKEKASKKLNTNELEKVSGGEQRRRRPQDRLAKGPSDQNTTTNPDESVGSFTRVGD